MVQNDSAWTPNGPYRMKSGKQAGKTLEQILLKNIADFLKMKWMLEKNAENPDHPNGYHRHLLWLVAKIDQLTANTVCSDCGQPATILPAWGSHHEGYNFIPCPLCLKCYHKTNWQRATTVKLSPWTLKNFRTKADKKRAWEAIKITLGITKKMTDQQLFEMLISI